jgi:hypothetical protein
VHIGVPIPRHGDVYEAGREVWFGHPRLETPLQGITGSAGLVVLPSTAMLSAAR